MPDLIPNVIPKTFGQGPDPTQFDENQEHVLNCKTILSMHKQEEESETPVYEKLFNGSVKEQVQIAKLFTQNMKIIENMRRTKS